LAGLVAVPLVVFSPAVAGAEPTLTCRGSAPIFTVRPNGDLALFQHEEPENGQAVWTDGAVKGSQWTGKTIAGPDGVVYSIPPDGTLKRFRWNGAGWDNGGAGQQIGQDWGRYTTPEYRNRITVDETGRIYVVDDQGRLRVYLWDAPNQKWLNAGGDVIATGWDQYNLITAGGAGVLYARKPSGELIRFRYHAESQRWTERDKQVGIGWQVFTRVFSPGGDALYGVTGGGDLLWYRYLETTGTWVGGDQGRLIGTGWQNDVDTTAMSDACKLTPSPAPERVTVGLDQLAPTRALLGKNGVPQYFYVNGYGQVVHGKQTNPDDPRIVQLLPIEGAALTKSPSAVLGPDDKLQVFALGQDGETRTATPKADGTGWNPYSSLGGWIPGAPNFVRGTDGLVRGFAVDGAGVLWSRSQATVDGPLLPWSRIGTGLTPDFTVVKSGNGFEVVARSTTNDVVVARYDQAGLGAWRTVPGGTTTGTPAAVVNPDGKLQVYATRSDHAVHTQRETASGFVGTWTSIPGLAVVGSPAAAVGADGTVKVSVRGNDTYMHVTEQAAPGSTLYRAWTVLEDARTGARPPSDTDPTMITTATGAVIITYRDANEIPSFFQSVSPSLTAKRASGATQYTGGAGTR
jgi:hypothetical protein